MSLALVSRRAALLAPWNRNELWRRARAVPSLDLRFAENKSLVDAVTGQSSLTFTRASSGTYVDSTGTLQTASTDVARFDHNPTTGESLGLLVEEARTNLLLRSEEFGTTWTSTGLSAVTANTTVAPDGSTTADTLVETTGVSEVHRVTQAAVSVTSGTSYTFSAFVKQGSRRYIYLGYGPNATWASGSGASAFFDLQLGTVNLSSNCTATITAFPGGWFRCRITAAPTATNANAFAGVGGSTNGISQTYTGDGGNALIAWGAQVEAGAFPTSYIPTTTATVTRSADVITDTTRGAALRTLYVEFSSPASGTRPVVSLDDDTANNRIELLTSGADPKLLVTSGGIAQADINGGTVTANTTARIGARFSTDNFAASISGGAAVVDTSGTMPTVDRIRIGSNQAGQYLNGPIARITGWDRPLPNLPTLTQ